MYPIFARAFQCEDGWAFTTIRYVAQDRGSRHQWPCTKSPVFGFEGCFDDILAHEPPAEVLQDVRNRENQGNQIQNVLTLENDDTIWPPEVAKTSRVLIGL